MGGMIVAIGAQNALVLRQGLARNHIFAVALTCWLCDVMLMSLGILGLGQMIVQSRTAALLLTLLGALFLSAYGIFAWQRAARGRSHLQAQAEGASGSLKAVLAATLAVTLLNPHVYLDTVVLIGSIAAPYSGAAKIWFLCGACTASWLWFFGLSYSAALLAPVLQRDRVWQWLDWLIGAVMFWMAAGLWHSLYRSLAA